MIDPVILIGSRLQLARKAAHRSQKALAALCGVGQSHISALERNARAPSISVHIRRSNVCWRCGRPQAG